RLLDREPRQLVSERNVGGALNQHSRGQAFIEAIDELAGKRLKQGELNVSGKDGDRFKQRARSAGQQRRASQNRVADGVRDLSVSGGEDLGDEKRIAARLVVQLLGV